MPRQPIVVVMLQDFDCIETGGDGDISRVREVRGFVRTGSSAEPGAGMYQTSRPGVFAVGDVRSGSVKRVASAVAEGAIAVRQVHDFLDAAGRR